jgi:hypothetical protein
VHDAVKIERAGKPATVLITEPFQGLVAAQAAKLGAAGYHALVLPHPVWGTEEVQLRALAARVADDAVTQLTGVAIRDII